MSNPSGTIPPKVQSGSTTTKNEPKTTEQVKNPPPNNSNKQPKITASTQNMNISVDKQTGPKIEIPPERDQITNQRDKNANNGERSFNQRAPRETVNPTASGQKNVKPADSHKTQSLPKSDKPNATSNPSPASSSSAQNKTNQKNKTTPNKKPVKEKEESEKTSFRTESEISYQTPIFSTILPVYLPAPVFNVSLLKDFMPQLNETNINNLLMLLNEPHNVLDPSCSVKISIGLSPKNWVAVISQLEAASLDNSRFNALTKELTNIFNTKHSSLGIITRSLSEYFRNTVGNWFFNQRVDGYLGYALMWLAYFGITPEEPTSMFDNTYELCTFYLYAASIYFGTAPMASAMYHIVYGALNDILPNHGYKKFKEYRKSFTVVASVSSSIEGGHFYPPITHVYEWDTTRGEPLKPYDTYLLVQTLSEAPLNIAASQPAFIDYVNKDLYSLEYVIPPTYFLDYLGSMLSSALGTGVYSEDDFITVNYNIKIPTLSENGYDNFINCDLPNLGSKLILPVKDCLASVLPSLSVVQNQYLKLCLFSERGFFKVEEGVTQTIRPTTDLAVPDPWLSNLLPDYTAHILNNSKLLTTKVDGAYIPDKRITQWAKLTNDVFSEGLGAQAFIENFKNYSPPAGTFMSSNASDPISVEIETFTDDKSEDDVLSHYKLLLDKTKQDVPKSNSELVMSVTLNSDGSIPIKKPAEAKVQQSVLNSIPPNENDVSTVETSSSVDPYGLIFNTKNGKIVPKSGSSVEFFQKQRETSGTSQIIQTQMNGNNIGSARPPIMNANINGSRISSSSYSSSSSSSSDDEMDYADRIIVSNIVDYMLMNKRVDNGIKIVSEQIVQLKVQGKYDATYVEIPTMAKIVPELETVSNAILLRDKYNNVRDGLVDGVVDKINGVLFDLSIAPSMYSTLHGYVDAMLANRMNGVQSDFYYTMAIFLRSIESYLDYVSANCLPAQHNTSSSSSQTNASVDEGELACLPGYPCSELARYVRSCISVLSRLSLTVSLGDTVLNMGDLDEQGLESLISVWSQVVESDIIFTYKGVLEVDVDELIYSASTTISDSDVRSLVDMFLCYLASRVDANAASDPDSIITLKSLFSSYLIKFYSEHSAKVTASQGDDGKADVAITCSQPYYGSSLGILLYVICKLQLDI